jgi:hypothetical protein
MACHGQILLDKCDAAARSAYRQEFTIGVIGRRKLQSAGRRKPTLLEPVLLSVEGLATEQKWPKLFAANRRQVGPPLSSRIRLDMAGAGDVQLAQLGKVQGFEVQAADATVDINY